MAAGIAAFVLTAALASGAEPAKPETPFETAKRLAASKEQKDRVQALQWLKALGQPGKPEGDEALARYGDLCLRFYAEGEKAVLAEAKRAYAELKEKSHSRWGLHGAVGILRISAVEGQNDDAIKGLDAYMATHSQDDSTVDAGYYLSCIAAAFEDNLDKLRLAAKSLDYSLKLLRSRKGYYLGLITEDQLVGKLGWVRNRIRELETGEPKLTYQKAEQARGAGQFAQAAKLYTTVWKEYPDHALSPPSGYHVGLCHFMTKDFKVAENKWEEFVKQNAIGPWRAQARLSMGDMSLEHQFDYNKARGIFDALVADLPKANHPTWQEATASIYERVGLCEYIKGRFKEASALFQKATEARPKNAQRAAAGWPDAGQWLVDACNRSDFPSPKDMLSQGTERSCLAIFLGDAYFLAERYEKGAGIFNRVHVEKDIGGTLEQRAYSRRREGQCYYQQFQFDKALGVLADFDTIYAKTEAARMGLTYKGIILCAQNKDAELEPVLRKIISKWSGTDEAAMAHMTLTSILRINGRYREALAEANIYLSIYPNHWSTKWVREYQIKTIHDAMQQKEGGKNG